MFVSVICAGFVRRFLVNLVKVGAVTEFTELRGRVIQESTFKTVKVRPKHTRLNRCFWPWRSWRLVVTLQNDKYTYRVTWSEDDNEYVGLCAEFPSLSWIARTPEAALRGIRKLVAEVVKDMDTNGETVPEPIACRPYSGKFVVRIPPHVHRKLAIEAAESGVSLNRIAGSKLSQ
jgi:predicted HicB family RNase H-like nuclease